METPISARRVTRSQTRAAANGSASITVTRKNEESEMGLTKSRKRNANKQAQQDRSALIDITNDSPIVGLAMGVSFMDKTPASSIMKQWSNRPKQTPGSGEDLLRGQVKTLLQKVEEDATDLSKFSTDPKGGPFLHLKALVNSPMGLLAPTPTNTPNIGNLIAAEVVDSNKKIVISDPVSSLPVIQDQLSISQMVEDMVDVKMQEGGLESQKSEITRSLLLDFSEKSEGSADTSDCNSVVSYQEMMAGENSVGRGKSSSTDDDNASVWSMQVNASSTRDEEEDEEGFEQEEEEDEAYYDVDVEEEDYEEVGGSNIDELCEGLNKMNVEAPKFEGKHTRFVYNSDGELEGEEEDAVNEASSPSILRLKGLPTPKGKHFRYTDGGDQEQ